MNSLNFVAMNLLAPQFLYGLFALAIPLIIHLFNFRKTKVIFFSSNQFLRKITDETSSKRNLKHIIILLCRLLFILFLVMAFAQPVIPPSGKTLQNNVQIYLDNSYSMSNEAEVELSGFDKAIGFVNEILDQYPVSTRYRLLTNQFEPFSNRYRSAEEIREALTEIKYSEYGRFTDEVIFNLENEFSNAVSADIYWISDFQKSYLKKLNTKDSLQLRIIPIQYTTFQNVYIDTVYIESPFSANGQITTLSIKFRNGGEVEVRNLLTRIYLDDNQVTSRSITIPAKGEISVQFDISSPIDNASEGQIVFEDFPVVFDNTFHFVLSKRAKVKIIELGSEKNNSYINKVYGNSTLFDYQFQALENPDYALLREAHMILVNQAETINEALMIQLKTIVSDGGSLVLIPGLSSEYSQISALLPDLRLIRSDTTENQAMALPEFDNPFYSGVFEETQDNILMPSARSLISWDAGRSNLLSFRNSQPFLSRLGVDGNIFLFASALHPDYTNFVQHALFVPIMYKIAFQSIKSNQPLYYRTDSRYVEIGIDSITSADLFILKNDEREIIPEQRKTGNKLVMNIENGQVVPGTYSLENNGEEVSKVAINFDRRESKLDVSEVEELSSIFEGSTLEVLDGLDFGELGVELSDNYKAKPLWKYMLLLAFVFLLAEVLVYRFMKS